MKKGNRNWAIGTLAAIAAGYVAGILTAPKSGKETRQDIKSAAAKTKLEAEKKLKALHSELNERIETGKQMAKEVKGAAKTELVEALGQAQLAKEKVRQILSALHEGDADDADLKKAVTEAKDALKHLKKFVSKDVQSGSAK